MNDRLNFAGQKRHFSVSYADEEPTIWEYSPDPSKCSSGFVAIIKGTYDDKMPQRIVDLLNAWANEEESK